MVKLMKKKNYTKVEGVSGRIGKALLESGLNQVEIARKLDIFPTAISRWKTGATEPTPANLKKLAKALGCDLNWLLSGECIKSNFTERNEEQTDGPEGEPSGHEITTNEELRMFLKDLVVAQAEIIALQKENKMLREEINSGGAIKKPQARRGQKN